MEYQKIEDNLYSIREVFSRDVFLSGVEEFNPNNNNWVFSKAENDDEQFPRIGFLYKVDSQGVGENLALINLGVIAKFICQRILKKNLILQRVNTNIQYFGQESTLHLDGPRNNQWSLVVFMSPFWSPEWGGEFVLGNQISIPYIPNSAVLFKSNAYHKGSAPNRYCNHPRLSLAFLFEEQEITSK